MPETHRMSRAGRCYLGTEEKNVVLNLHLTSKADATMLTTDLKKANSNTPTARYVIISFTSVRSAVYKS